MSVSNTESARAHEQALGTGPYLGPASGRPVDFTVIDVARIQVGPIVEHWGVPDRFAVLAQTGVLERLAGPVPARFEGGRR